MIWGIFKPLNKSEYFKDKYGQDDATYLLVATDEKYAARLTVREGQVSVENVLNEPAELKAATKEVQSMIKCTFDTFLAIASGKISTMGLLKMLVTGKLKIKGLGKLMRMLKYFNVIAYLNKQKMKEMAGDAGGQERETVERETVEREKVEREEVEREKVEREEF